MRVIMQDALLWIAQLENMGSIILCSWFAVQGLPYPWVSCKGLGCKITATIILLAGLLYTTTPPYPSAILLPPTYFILHIIQTLYILRTILYLSFPWWPLFSVSAWTLYPIQEISWKKLCKTVHVPVAKVHQEWMWYF